MKNVLALVLLFVVLRAVPAHAVAANPTANAGIANGQMGGQISAAFEDQSNFGKIGAWGNQSQGNPGYLVLKGCDANNTCYPYYFWVASDGNLYQASYITIAAYSSFPSGNWNRTNMSVGSKVGSQ